MDELGFPVLSRPETLREIVVSFLRDAITEGRFRPGQRLVERELCDMLKVSRPPLREALRQLEAEKLITIVPNRGPIVASLDPQEAREIYAFRALLEGYAAHECARLATSAQIQKLGEKVKLLHAQYPDPDRKALLAIKAEFYDVLLAASGNRIIRDSLMGLLSRINLLRATSFSRPERLAESLAEIDRIYDGICRRDPEAAQKMATLHIKNAERAALGVLT